MSEDRYVTDEIRSTLERDERLPHPTEVAVSERHGTVTLRGSVGTFHQRRAAVRIARSTTGDRANRLEPTRPVSTITQMG